MKQYLFKNKRMVTLIFVNASILLAYACFLWIIYIKFFSDRVEQEIIKSPFGKDKTICPSGECIVTYVIKDGTTIQSWYDDNDSCNPDRGYKREQEGEKLLKQLK